MERPAREEMLYMDLHGAISPGYLFSHRPWPIHLLEGGENYLLLTVNRLFLFSSGHFLPALLS